LSELGTEKKMLKIINAMEIVEMSQPTIAKKAIIHALLNEDEEEASALFGELRARATLTEEGSLTLDGYISNLENLKKIAVLSSQESVSQDLTFLIDFFRENDALLYRILSEMKKQYIHEGLKQNYMNN